MRFERGSSQTAVRRVTTATLIFFGPHERRYIPIRVKYGTVQYTISPLAHAEFGRNRERGGYSTVAPKLGKYRRFWAVLASLCSALATVYIDHCDQHGIWHGKEHTTGSLYR